MGAGVTQSSSGYSVTVVQPSSLVDGAADAREAFEAVWRRLPPFVEDNAFCALADDGGVFLKGQRMRPRVRIQTLRQAGRLVREVENLRRMSAAGVPVPDVLAWGSQTRSGFPVRSFVLLRLLRDAEDLRAIVRRTSADERADLWQPVGETVARLHATRLFHRDLTARNVLVQRPGARSAAPLGDDVRVHLIDCPRAEYGWLASRRAFLRRSDLFRLGRSVLKAGGRAQEVRALLLGAGADRADDLLDVIVRAARSGGERSLRLRFRIAFGV